MTRRLSDYVCGYCYGDLVAHPGGNWSCDYHGFGVKRRSKKYLAQQRAIAATVGATPLPPVTLTREQRTEIGAALFGGYDD